MMPVVIVLSATAQDSCLMVVVDSATGHGLEGVHVYVDGFRRAFVASKGGMVSLPCGLPEGTRMYVSHPEYQQKIVSFHHRGDTLWVRLSPYVRHLEEVVVTATRTERRIKDLAIPTQVITSEGMLKTGTTNVAEALSNAMPGFEFYHDGRGMTFRLQGIDAKYTLFLVDGERLAGENRENTDYYRLTTSSIDRIEIVKGASSSLYGSSAMGGVVNLITPVPRQPFESNIYGRLSRFGEIETGANVGIRQGKIRFFTDAVRKSMNGYDLTPSTPDLYTMEPYCLYSVYQKVMYEYSPRLTFVFRGGYYQRERFDVSSVPTHPFYNDVNGGMSATWKVSSTATCKASWHADRYRTMDVLERLAGEKHLVYADEQHTGRFLYEYRMDRGWKTEQHHLVAGGEFFCDEMFSERIRYSRQSIENYTLLGQDEIKINETFSAIAGGRLDWHSIYGPHLSPKLSGMYKTGRFTSRLSYGHGFRAPSIKERYYDFDLGFIVVKGNEHLVPERSQYVSLSSEYQGNSFMPSVTFYLNHVTDMIHEIPLANVENGYTYANFSSVRIFGIDYLQQVKITSWCSLFAGYNYTDAWDEIKQETLSGVCKHSGMAGCDFSGVYRHCRWVFSFSGKCYGSRKYTAMDENTYRFYETSYPSYSIWRISFTQQWWRRGIEVTAGVNNLFNHIGTSDLINIDPGRRVYLAVRLSPEKIFASHDKITKKNEQ